LLLNDRLRQHPGKLATPWPEFCAVLFFDLEPIFKRINDFARAQFGGECVLRESSQRLLRNRCASRQLWRGLGGDEIPWWLLQRL